MKKLRLLTLIFCIITACYVSFSSAPQWWEERGVVESVEGENSEQVRAKNYEAANVGQLMYIAKRAAEELNEKAEGGAGEAVNSMVATFPTYNAANPDANYAVLNIGQLKNVAKPFYDRLWELSAANEGSVNFPSSMVFVSGGTESSNHKYPWAAMPENPGESDYAINYEIANIGQVKNLFSWSLNDVEEIFEDTDGDGIPDSLENLYGGDWEHVAGLHFVSLRAVGDTMRIGESNVPLNLPLKVRAVDERGNPVSNVPLLVRTIGGGTIVGTSFVTSSDGECSIPFTPNFAYSSINTISVNIDSLQYFGSVFFLITPESSFEEVTPENIISAKNTDNDPIVPEWYDKDKPLVPAYHSLASCTYRAKKISEIEITAPGNPSEASGCTGHGEEGKIETDIEYIGWNNYEGAGYTCDTIECPEHGTVKSISEIKDIELDIEMFNEIISMSESEYLSNFFFFMVQSYNGEIALKEITKNVWEGNLPKHSDGPENINTYGIYLPWIYGYPVEDYKGDEDCVAELKGRGSFLVDSQNVTITGVKIEVKANAQGFKNNITLDGCDPWYSSLRFKSEDPTKEAVAEISFEFYYEDINLSSRSHKYLLIIPPNSDTSPYALPADESAGPKYRKISLSGRPIADEKPQMEEENDIEFPETFIDALSLSLHHTVKDIFIRIPESGFQLSVTRDYKASVWNFKSGLRPHEAPENVFGVNWSSNLISYVRLERQILNGGASRTGPDTATVVDENGAAFSFGVVDNTFYPMPSGRNQKQAYLNSLRYDRESGSIVLTKKYGNILVYEPAALTREISMNRLEGSKSSMKYVYYRLKYALDRYGNKLVYDYPPQRDTLIPQKVYLEGDINSCLTIQQENGRITKIWDAEGNCTEYEYSAIIPPIGSPAMTKLPPTLHTFPPVSVLSAVKSNGVTLFSYDYGSLEARLDNYALKSSGEAYYDFESSLKSLTDATNRTYSFEYYGFCGVYSYDNRVGYYISNAVPQMVRKVVQPDGGNASFYSTSSVYPRVLQGGILTVRPNPQRATRVIDADGNSVKYTWIDGTSGMINLELLKDFGELYHIPYDSDFSNPIAIYFPYMRIDHYTGSGEDAQLLGSETFEFDIDAGMALKKVTDFSGNITEYEYSDAIHESDPRLGVGYAARFSDPTKETRYVGGIAQSKIFTYSDNYRIMESMTDELRRVTQWTVDEMGRRTDEKLYASASDASSGQNPVKQTQFSYDNTFKGFLTDTLLIDGAGQGKNMLSRNVPDANGRLASTIVDPDGLALTTTFAYNRNGRKTLAVDANGNSTSFEYDAFNRLVKRTNPDGSTNLISYDAAGRKISETNENGVETTYAYNANGLRTHTSILMEDSQDDITTQIAYSSAGKMLSSTDANGNLTSFEYDGLGRLLKMTKYEGSDTSENGTSYVTTYTYTGNCGSGAFSTDNFKPSTVTDARGNTSIFTHDALYRETSVTLPYGESGSTTSYEYDAVGNKIKETDALGNVTQFFYDAQNNLIRTVFADDSEISATYSAAKLQLSQTDEMSNTTTFEYDLAGRKVKSVLPEVYDALSNTNQSPVEEYSYDKNGNLTAMRDALGNLYNTVYDSRNRKIAEVSPAIKLADGSYARPIKQSVYDAVGNVIKAIDPKGNATDTVYDNANRAVSVTFPEVEVGGNGTSGGTLQRPQELRSYDKNGNVISATNPRGIVTETSYNCFNKPVLVVKNAGATSESDKITESLSYDANGNLEVITDGNGNKTKYVYDAMNRRTQAIYGYGSTTTRSDSFAYDALNLTNRKGVAITYDSRNRIQSEAVNKRVYSYDACGRILSVKDESGESSGVSTDVYYSYDALGRLLSESNGGRTHFYQYDLANRRVKSFYGSTSSIFESSTFTHTLDYAYNTNGKISTITDQKGRVTSYTYDLNGNVVKKTYVNNLVSSANRTSSVVNRYDALNRLKESELYSRDSFSLCYVYDLNGNVLVMRSDNWSFLRTDIYMSYDAFDRLRTTSHYRDPSILQYIMYSYDKNGNRKSETFSQTAGNTDDFVTRNISYTVNSLNQITNVSEEDIRYDEDLHALPSTYTSTHISYNERGNVISISGEEVSTSFEYDMFDMLKSTEVLGGDESVVRETSNAYDYRGRRISHIENEDETQYSYGDGVSVLETKGAKTTLFYRGSDQGGGVGGINYAEYSDGSELNYKFYNLRGDVIFTLDGEIRRSSSTYYYEFGKSEQLNGDIKTDRHRANTKVEDSGNLLNEGKRFRHLEYGIFLTPDPLEYVDGYNPYIYCGQNPWGKWDPEGLAFLGYDSMGEYFKEVGKFYSGYGLAVKDTVVGAYDMVRHPVDTAKGIAHAVTNPVSTAKAVANNISETWNSGSEGQGRIVGNALIAFATSGASATKVGNLTNIAGKGVKSASALVKGEAKSAAKVANEAKNLAESVNKIPSEAYMIRDRILNGKPPPKNFKGGKIFENRGNDLPTHTSDGKPITYRKYDISAKQKGVPRTTERVLIGSDGSSYYTNDHYETFTKMKSKSDTEK